MEMPILSQTTPAPERRRAGPDENARRKLRRDLASAVSRGSFALQFQPRVALATGRQTGAEALLRWPNGSAGLVAPGVFLPIAAEVGLGAAIGAWVLQSACSVALQWPVEMTVAVNISAEQIAGRQIQGQVTSALAETGLPPERLELELPEAALVDADADTLLLLAGLRDIGVGIVLDDFGATHASLGTLRRTPLSAVKLDSTVTRGLPHDVEDIALARASVQLAHTLGLTVIAEGIETEAQRACLVACGCDEGQGYLFSVPLTPERMPPQPRH